MNQFPNYSNPNQIKQAPIAEQNRRTIREAMNELREIYSELFLNAYTTGTQRFMRQVSEWAQHLNSINANNLNQLMNEGNREFNYKAITFDNLALEFYDYFRYFFERILDFQQNREQDDNYRIDHLNYLEEEIEYFQDPLVKRYIVHRIVKRVAGEDDQNNEQDNQNNNESDDENDIENDIERFFEFLSIQVGSPLHRLIYPNYEQQVD